MFRYSVVNVLNKYTTHAPCHCRPLCHVLVFLAPGTVRTQPITRKGPEIEWRTGNTIIQDPLSDYLARTRSASPICSAPLKLWLKQIVALRGRNGNCLDGIVNSNFRPIYEIRLTWRGINDRSKNTYSNVMNKVWHFPVRKCPRDVQFL